MRTCRGCKAMIVWRRTPAGRFLACDPPLLTVRMVSIAEATEEDKGAGRRVTLVRRNGSVVTGVEIPRYPIPDPARGELEQGREAHWASCPAAKDFRR